MGLRGPKPKGQEDWMIEVAELMIQEHMSFSAACLALGKKFENTASERTAQYSEAFQNILDALSYRFYARIGDNPMLTKGVLAGTLMTAIRKLGEMDQWDKVAMPGKLLADLMGWLEKHTEDAVVIGNLTQSELDRVRAELKAQEEQTKTTVVVVDGTPN
jgi:hypothetical protein